MQGATRKDLNIYAPDDAVAGNATADAAAVYANTIPEDFRNQPNWILWKYQREDENGKPFTYADGRPCVKKIPLQADGRTKAKSNTPATWTDFETAVKALQDNPDKFDGLGWCVPLTGNVRYWGFDWDDAIDPKTGYFRVFKVGEPYITKDAPMQPAEFFEKVTSYGNGNHVETTPSLAGFRGYIKRTDGKDVPAGRHDRSWGTRNEETQKVPGVEIYSTGRYFTFSGNPLPGSKPVVIESNELADELLDLLAPVEAKKSTTTTKKDRAKSSSPVPAVPSSSLNATEDEMYELAGRLVCIREQNSARHDFNLGMIGVLLRHGYEGNQVRAFLTASCALMFDNGEGQERLEKASRWLDNALTADDLSTLAGFSHLEDKGVFSATNVKVVRSLLKPKYQQTKPGEGPKGFRTSGDMIQYWTKTGDEEEWLDLCSPIRVSRRFRDRATGSHHIEIQMLNDRGEQDFIIVPLADTHLNPGSIAALLVAHAIPYMSNRNNTNTLVGQYLKGCRPAVESVCVEQPGWYDGTYVPATRNASIGVDSNVSIMTNQTPMLPSGTLEEWQENVSAYAPGNSRLMFALSMAFAGPLLTPLGAEGGGIGYLGETSKGKTICQFAAASVYAHPLQYKNSFNSTKNGLEAVCTSRNDSLLILDEMAQAPGGDVEAILYNVANGAAKDRMTKDLKKRDGKAWRVLALGSGELSAEQKIRSGFGNNNKTIKGGMVVRYPEIPAVVGRHGVFEDTHGFSSSREFSERLERNTKTYFGTALPAFIERFAHDYDGSTRRALKLFDLFVEKAQSLTVDCASEVSRVVNRFAVIAAAGELATMYGVTGWQPNEANEAALRMLKDWLVSIGGMKSGFDVERGIERVLSFIIKNESRFDDSGTGYASRDRVGFRTPLPDGRVAYDILTDEFVRLLGEYDPATIAKALDERGMLEHDDGRWQKKYKRVKDFGRPWVYRIIPDVEEKAEQKPEEVPVSDPVSDRRKWERLKLSPEIIAMISETDCFAHGA